jgi:tetrahydromethanopterin S-methyltransferase subunit G
MELTQEHFDKQFEELNKRLDNMATKAELNAIRSEMVTKTDLETALETQTKTLESYTDEVAETILEGVNTDFETVNARLDDRNKKIGKIEEDVNQLKGALHLS